MKNMKLSAIKIRDSFANSKPNKKKMWMKRELYKHFGELSPIVVDGNNVLVDGYISYLILKEFGIESTKVENLGGKYYTSKFFKEKETYYLYGVHRGNNKEYVWMIPENKVDKIIGQVLPGDQVIVNTMYGKETVTVTRIELLKNPPVDRPIRSVVGRI